MNILDPRFQYTSSFATDLRKTFARIRRRNRELSMAQQLPSTPPATVVTLTTGRRKTA